MSCQACDTLTDKECLSFLDAEFTSLSDKLRLSYAKSYLPDEYTSYCSDVSDKSCLSMIDLAYASFNDKTKLSVLEIACEAEEYASSIVAFNSAENVIVAPQSSVNTSLVSILACVALVVGAVFFRRRQSKYEQVSETEDEFEASI